MLKRKKERKKDQGKTDVDKRKKERMKERKKD